MYIYLINKPASIVEFYKVLLGSVLSRSRSKVLAERTIVFVAEVEGSAGSTSDK